MKSVKSLSEELGVSKQTIFNNIKRLNIETIKEDNTSFIKKDNDIEKIIQRITKNKKKYGYENNINNNQKNESEKFNSNDNEKLLEILEKQINSLNAHIKKQENQHESTIEFYRKELQERSKLLENQQILTLESNKKIQKLERQLEEERHLNYSFDTSNNDRQNIDAQEATYTTDYEDANEDQEGNKKSWEDISKSLKDKSTRKEEVQTEDVPSNLNDNNDVEGGDAEIQPKKGFWSRLFGS